MALVEKLRGLAKLLFLGALEFGQVNRLFRRIHRGQLKCLTYHSITPRSVFFENGISPADLKTQIRYLARHYHVVDARALGDPGAYVSNRVNIVLTFDDGFKDNRTVATNLLREERLSAIFFLIAGCVAGGDMPGFIRGRSEAAHRTVDCADVDEMLACGMAIGAHGVQHDDYAELAYADGLHDAVLARELLEQITGSRVIDFAFPWGRFREPQPAALLSIYERVFLTKHGFNSVGDRVLCRNEVDGNLHLYATASGSLDFFAGLIGSRRS